MLDFVLYTCCWRAVEATTNWAIEKAHLGLRDVEWMWIPQPGDALIGRARSVALSTWYWENMAPYLIFLDSDIVFTADDLRRLYEHLEAGYDLIGGTYCVRGGKQLAHYGTDGGKITLDGKITEVKYLSTGFMGISRNLVEKMIKELKLPLCNEDDWAKCYPFFESGAYNDPEYGWMFISEDWDFCNKARKVGVRPYLDTSIRLGHQGVQLWGVDDVLRQQAEAVAPPLEPSSL